jgi:hypothetical protein
LSPTPPALFCDGFFKIGPHKLFAWAGFQPQSSWSLPSERLGLQVWATGAWLLWLFLIEGLMFMPEPVWTTILPLTPPA